MELWRPANTATFVTFPIIDADGDTVTGATGLDSEWFAWADGASPGQGSTFQDLTNEALEIAATGIYSLSLTAAELPVASPYVYIRVQTSSSGAKTQHILINTATWYADVTRWNGTALPANVTAGYVQLDMGQTLPASPTQSTMGHALVTARQATEYLDADISSRLAPTVAARTLNVNATGGAELDLDQTLSSTPTAQTVGEALKFARQATAYVDATISSRLPTSSITLTGGAVNLNQAQTLTIPATTQSTVGHSLVTMRFATDYLDAAVSGVSGLQLSTVLSGTPTAQTVGEALKFAREATAYVDAAISSRLALATTLSGSPTAQTVGEALKYAREATEYLDAAITSRLAPTTNGRTLDVDAAGGAEVGSFQAGALTSGAFAAGAITATAIAADAIGDSQLDMVVASTFADALLRRNLVSGSSGAGGGGDRDVRSALFGLRNRVSIVAGTLTIYGADDTTAWWTGTVASQAVSEILVEVDPV